MKKAFVLLQILSIVTLFYLSNNLLYANTVNKKDGAMFKKTIAIDLDGVLDNYTKYTEDIPEIKDGAKEFIEKLSKKYELVLFTTRSPKLTVEWLEKNNIDRYFKDVTNIKIPAYIYLDDRSIQFKGNYNKTIEDIENFEVYWK